ncbi:hypothetical protein Snov_4363 [Ancylobacter novellus DSM 506]|uniref:Uncharacterized protein n=1 Tax=Ancylobacter novellus (strain ATCC 8093 / DSM 506 / JCM 20403 / CCM 1077 / IAM 12100 / NBRC 12443 / NCIMB 10456) TaxID=639283 RepID=D7A2U2_ANCN5|nr:hypothetical protein Snov_4363 [Ancylobacter novellus DSM 506]
MIARAPVSRKRVRFPEAVEGAVGPMQRDFRPVADNVDLRRRARITSDNTGRERVEVDAGRSVTFGQFNRHAADAVTGQPEAAILLNR